MNDNELVKEIIELKKERNAVILSHNYQIGRIQDLADFVGDSFQLACSAKQTDADIIVFCGVDFMAETAAIINPEKKVLLPDMDAQCPMAAMLPEETIKKAREDYPDAAVVMYINTIAEAKTHADCICTSGNAVKVVENMDSDTILFAPDRNLAHYVRQRTEKDIIAVPPDGICIVHERILPEDILNIKSFHPHALLAVHAECRPKVQAMADHVGSTKTMLDFVGESDADEFIIGTEPGIIHRMKKQSPNKTFYPAKESSICLNMKKINLLNLKQALEEIRYEVEVPKEIARAARAPIERMLQIG